ncbi:hypothetical protein Golob_013061 [Gossypium lobatum]|uniref:RNase H type-1 domain-containing protein n=1 Tax=Gossypium lobatum TaxID=34289 RepID=A0A7J8LNP3_9ROSI|nr:hypothetical protein [Gossypium lobatum]
MLKILVEWAELVAFEESLKVASAINISKVIFESDCANLVNGVKKQDKIILFWAVALMRHVSN